MSRYGVISGPYFPVFGLNTGKYGPKITPYLDTFQALDTFPQNFHARKFGEIRVFCAVIIYALYSTCHMCLQIYFHDISKNSHKWADFTDFIKKRPMNLLFQKFETLISGIISTKINKHYIKLCREYNTQLIAQKKYECIQRKKRMFRNKLLTL